MDAIIEYWTEAGYNLTYVLKGPFGLGGGEKAVGEQGWERETSWELVSTAETIDNVGGH